MRILIIILTFISANAFGGIEITRPSDKSLDRFEEIIKSPEAIETVKNKAEDGDPESQFYLGLMFVSGQGMKEDALEGVNWLRKSAEQGNALAQFYFGGCYLDGLKGFPKNYDEAFKWIKKSAEQGNIDAQAELGVLYKSGRGVAKNDVEAFKWYKKAAEQGQETVQSDLAICYIMGAGVPRDYVEGYAWLSLSCSGRFVLSRQREALNSLESQMSSAQVERAQKRCKEIQAEIMSRKASSEKKWWEFWR